jgi:hypothetical protein
MSARGVPFLFGKFVVLGCCNRKGGKFFTNSSSVTWPCICPETDNRGSVNADDVH